MHLHTYNLHRIPLWATFAVCAAMFSLMSPAQTTLLTAYGQGNQDAGIDIILPNQPVTLEWSQSSSFSDVSIYAGLHSFTSSGPGWATLSSDIGQVASTEFCYPTNSIAPFNYGSVDLFDGLYLPAGTYSLTVGAYVSEDEGWGVPAEYSLYSADDVTYLGTVIMGSLQFPVDFSIVSVPEPCFGSFIGLCLLWFNVCRAQRRR